MLRPSAERFAAGYDAGNEPVERAGLAAIRRDLLAPATGRTIEIGAGTGLNLAHYPPAVTRLVLTEPDEHMRERLAAKLATSGRPASVEPWPAEALLAADASFDTVVCTMVLCTVRDPDRALAEVRRVLAPGGRLLFIEHVRSRRRGLALLQQAMTPVYVVMARGCHPNRDTLAAIVAAGFEVERHRREIAPCTPAMERELIIGAAQRPGAGATGRRGGP